MISYGLRKMMTIFEAAGLLNVAHGRGKEPPSVETEQFVALAVEEKTMGSTHGTCSEGSLARQTDLARTIVNKIVGKVM